MREHLKIKQWGRLRRKIIAWSFVPTSIILTIVALVMYIAYQQVTEELVFTRDQQLIRLAASQLITEMSEYTSRLDSVARRANASLPLPFFQRDALQQSSNQLVIFDGGVVLLNTHGIVVATEPDRPDLIGENWSTYPYFAEAVRNRTPLPVFSNILPDGPDGGDVIAMAVPIFSGQDQFLGLVVGMFKIEPSATNSFLGSIVRLRLKENGAVYLVDESGRIIYHNDSSYIGKDASDTQAVQSVLAGQSGTVRTMNLDGQKDVITSFSPVPRTPWGLVTEEDWGQLTNPSQRYGRYLLLLLALGIIVPAIVVARGVQRITNPITELNEAAQKVAGGEFGAKIEIKTGDELEELGDQFNLMSHQLRESYATLEKRVAERTHRLQLVATLSEKLNAILDPQELLAEVVNQIKDNFGYYYAQIYLLDETGEYLYVTEGTGDVGIAMRHSKYKIPIAAETSLVARAARLGEIVTVNDVTQATNWLRNPLLPNTLAEITVPIHQDGQVVGVLDVQEDRVSSLDEGDENLLRSLANQIAVAFKNAQLYESAQEELRERKRAEEELHSSELRYKALFDNAPVSIFTKDSDGRYTSANADTLTYWDGDPVGKTDHDLLPAHIADPLRAADLKVMKTGQELAVEENVIMKGNPITVLSRKVPLHDSVGNIVGILGISVNISQLKETERILQQAKESAEEANRAKSTFLANMSHELRTPLNAILGFTQLMVRDPGLQPEQRDNLQTINRSGEHLLSLINDVLEMSKIEAGRITIKQTSFSLVRLLSDLESMFQLRVKEKGVELLFHYGHQVPQFILADESKLRQVLINLLSNAVKFTTEGSIQLWVDFDTSTAPQLVFAIEDTGPGIAPDQLKRIFDPFVQANTGQKSEGTGLGLPISQRFIKMMGGDISATSELGLGSTFTFNIEVIPTDSGNEIQAKPKRHVTGLAEGQPTYRLLIVEDIEPNRKLMVRLLEPLGFEVREAVNGLEALKVFEEWKPDLIWMDMRMPIMNGYEATQRIKSTMQGQSTRIVALTASAFEEERANILSGGCDDFIRKPFYEEEIYVALEKHLGVEFVYEELVSVEKEEEPSPPTAVALTDDNRNQLDPIWLNELKQATLELDLDLMLSLIEQIQEQLPNLATTLAKLATNFEYDKIMDILKHPEQQV